MNAYTPVIFTSAGVSRYYFSANGFLRPRLRTRTVNVADGDAPFARRFLDATFDGGPRVVAGESPRLPAFP